MADETGVTVLLTDGSEEHFESASKWTSREDGGLLLISLEPNGDSQEIVAEYLSGRAVRVCHGPPFRVVESPEDDKTAIYEAGFQAGKSVAEQEHAEASSANKAKLPAPAETPPRAVPPDEDREPVPSEV